MLRDLRTFLDKVSTQTNILVNIDSERGDYIRLYNFSLKLYNTLLSLKEVFIQLFAAHSAQAVPDTKLTLKKYSGAKFEFLVGLCHHCFPLQIWSKLKVHCDDS